MASMEPTFRRGPDGCLLLTDSAEAKFIKNQHRERDYAAPRPAAVVRKEAEEMVKKEGGDVSNSKHLLGCFEIQFGCFRGMTFKWIVENSPGYAGYLVAGMEKDEAKPTDNRWINKMALNRYLDLWEEGRKLVEMKRKQKPTPIMKVKATGAPQTDEEPEMSDEQLLLLTQEMEHKISAGCQANSGVPTLSSRDMFVPTVSTQRKALLSGDHLQVLEPLSLKATVQKPLRSTTSVQESSPATSATLQPSQAVTTSISAVMTSTPTVMTPSPHTSTVSPVISEAMTEAPSRQDIGDLCLPARWKKTIPKVDQMWISKSLFCWTKSGGVELVPGHLSQL